MIVRAADGEDMPWLLEQLQEFDRFVGSGYPLFPDIDQARKTLDDLITKHVFLVAEQDEECRGFICGLLAPHFFNPSIVTLTELLWWVPIEHRGSRAGALLLSEFMEIGKQYAHWIVMTLEEKSPVKESTLTKRGFIPKERNFLCEVAR